MDSGTARGIGESRMTTRRGVTLPELLIAMVIMVLIAGVVSSLYFASLHVWRRCSSQSQAEPPAHMATSRLTKELKNAYQVSSMGPTYITFLLPRTDGSGANILPLQTAREVSYYLSDDTGRRDRTGSSMWRKDTDMDTGYVRQQRIASNVQSLDFDYETTGENRVLAIYALSITVLGQEGRQTYQSQFGAHVAFRNP